MTPEQAADDAVLLLNDVAERVCELLTPNRAAGIDQLRAAVDRFRAERGGARPIVIPAWIDDELRRGLPRGRPSGRGFRRG